ncbi:pyridoxamine 5'-phosphate oxidase family protein [Arthrobacter bambusae]|uniref:pyridoxamine 5'-phosphate oxidase family protein n=1 Tax=Arthrobacter bambusae TaxID=1338426 RepID=UPI0027812CB9|nr:pyridoxamine 5'-phosphate oxidase family protein [Arthrobacter bambusae]MDQ0028675.1 nitroimidazol reductase NimA-like FMN-containing flavoprotein (pyridoxamine 5'-phosphate oxidase superfamily) [Arthrobacter bambusae]MDQ0096531.1 nitroimidazol reductase NimA-like FMN-containing flavoprotein (pyridoxamine 5'-phosphate oxidase superfamily) [Arthrobacter bambusae]
MNPQSADAVERLSPEECLELLGHATVGRLAVIVGKHPDIFPVNYVVDRGSIVFRTGVGTKFWSTMRDPCALEIDGFEAGSGKAWSVVARGPAHLIVDLQEKAAADALHLDPWQPGSKSHYLRLTLDALTGRRFKATRPDIWNTPLWDARSELFH